MNCSIMQNVCSCAGRRWGQKGAFRHSVWIWSSHWLYWNMISWDLKPWFFLACELQLLLTAICQSLNGKMSVFSGAVLQPYLLLQSHSCRASVVPCWYYHLRTYLSLFSDCLLTSLSTSTPQTLIHIQGNRELKYFIEAYMYFEYVV